VALKRSPEEDEDWSCLGCRTAGKGLPDTPGELPTRRRRGPRGSRTWWRAGGAVGGLWRDTTARMLVDDDESGSDYDKEHDQGHFDGGGPPCKPPHTAPAEPYDARGRPCDRDRPGRAADGVLFARETRHGRRGVYVAKACAPTSSPA